MRAIGVLYKDPIMAAPNSSHYRILVLTYICSHSVCAAAELTKICVISCITYHEN